MMNDDVMRPIHTSCWYNWIWKKRNNQCCEIDFYEWIVNLRVKNKNKLWTFISLNKSKDDYPHWASRLLYRLVDLPPLASSGLKSLKLIKLTAHKVISFVRQILCDLTLLYYLWVWGKVLIKKVMSWEKFQ